MRFAFAIAVISMILMPSRALAQAPAPPPQPDLPTQLLTELLTEVRGLRQSMERAATVGARIQLLVARVQLQEQRIAELSRRLMTVRDEMSSLETQASGLQSQVAMFEKAGANSNAPAEERNQMEQMLQGFKSQVATFEKRRLDLANEESLLMQQVAADQGRWSDVNSQLDELERTLSAPAKKP
jgi:chromosome segregation ATPase